MLSEKNKSALEAVAWWSSFAALLVLLAFHVTMIQLSNMPLSPLKLQYSDLIEHYVNPLFTQNWLLFAPQPLDEDIALMVRGRFKDPRTGRLQTTRWLNVTEPLIDAVRKNRLTPLALVELGEANVVVSFNNDLELNPKATFVRNGKRFLILPVPVDVDTRDTTVLTRTGLASLEIEFPGMNFSQVQVGISRYRFPRFTKRFDADTLDYATITPVQWQRAAWVAPYCCVANPPNADPAQ
jgi:hypothetical protein